MADDDKRQLKTWQVPRFVENGNKRDVHEFMITNVKDGREYMEAEPGFAQLEQSIRILSGTPDPKLAQKQADGRYSKLVTNRLKRNLREMINSLADITYVPGFHSDSNDTQAQAELLNRVGYSWYTTRFIDIKFKEAIQWMAICPRAYLEICYRQIPGHRNKRDIDLIARNSFQVVKTGVPENKELQECYTVTIIKDMPVYQAHAAWPDHTAVLIPDRETPQGWIEKAKVAFDSVFADTPAKRTAKNPTVRLYYQYVIDLSINRSGKVMKMGYGKDAQGVQYETPWSYEVPSVGGPIKAGYDQNGIPVFRRASEDDCRLFPNRRLIVGTENDHIYDGPAFDWHGMVPLMEISADSWVFGDYSMVHDVAPIQDTINEVQRVIHQTIRNRFNPSMKYDMRAITRDKMKTFKPEMGGQKIGYNGQVSTDPMRPALPDNFYEINGWIYDANKKWEEDMDYQMGIKDPTALAKAKAGDEESMQKMAELAGPIVKGVSRDIERGCCYLFEMFKYLVFQYYDTPKIFQIVGADGTTPENFDYDPGNLIPSHLPGEKKDQPSGFTRMQRAQWAAEHLPFNIVPNTLNRLNQVSQKLMVLQLWRGGFPIDPWTLADIMGLPSFGKKPEGTNDILSRYAAWKDRESDFSAAEQEKLQIAQQAGQQQNPEDVIKAMIDGSNPNPAGGLPALIHPPNPNRQGTQGTGPKGGFTGSSGRAPTGQRSPIQRTKGDGRPVMVESN